ncbi:AbrB/MazE/SpoVT family DNA-binding domain-containing protein [Candidatus Parcubacteria bacterium]|nr:MAG: AbrB/MazE/SpoVT family DNA-binding domain-containing protein [Candidatus Parcubacteria bacterium]
METQTKIQKITSKGQITLPVSWRKKFNARQIMIKPKGDSLEIKPINLEMYNTEVTVFDALRDNKGRGLKAKDLIKILKKIDSKNE